MARPARRPLRRVSPRKVELAIMDLSDERVGGREHDRLADERHVGWLDPAWDEALIAVIDDGQDQ